MDELKRNMTELRGRIEVLARAAEDNLLADASKQPRRVARDSFKAVANDYRRALSHADEILATLDRVRRNHAHTQVEHITDQAEREAALKRILGE